MSDVRDANRMMVKVLSRRLSVASMGSKAQGQTHLSLKRGMDGGKDLSGGWHRPPVPKPGGEHDVDDPKAGPAVHDWGIISPSGPLVKNKRGRFYLNFSFAFHLPQDLLRSMNRR